MKGDRELTMKTCPGPVIAFRAVLNIVVFLLLTVSAYAQDDVEPVEKSWEAAKVYLPGVRGETTIDRIKTDKPLPVVIYLHGCYGFTYESESWGNFFKDSGYIAILPDSFARRNYANCDPKTKKGGKFPKAHAMRLEEIGYAYDHVKKSPWADINNIFLMGYSEGGVAAARTKVSGLSGIIISGWGCTNNKNPAFDGIFAPPETPVLSLEWERDEWQSEATRGSCADKFRNRIKAKQVLFPGHGHDVFGQKSAREAVADFLRENLK